MINKKLSFDEQIEWLQDHNVTIDDKTECGDYLRYKTYFYKIISYVKSFNSQNNIEIKSFDQLVDLSSIDMELRYFLLRVCLDVEHWIRSFILRIITNDPNEDGYEIVQKVLSRDKDPQEFKRKLFSNVGYYDKYGDFQIQKEYKTLYRNPPIWAIMEICSFGKLRSFVEYLSEQRPNNTDLMQIRNSFKYINKLRNYCAHNKNILNKNIYYDENLKLPHTIFSTLGSDGFTKHEIKCEIHLQIILAIRMHNRLCSKESNNHRAMEFSDLLKRIDKNNSLHINTIFQDFFSELNKTKTTYFN